MVEGRYAKGDNNDETVKKYTFIIKRVVKKLNRGPICILSRNFSRGLLNIESIINIGNVKKLGFSYKKNMLYIQMHFFESLKTTKDLFELKLEPFRGRMCSPFSLTRQTITIAHRKQEMKRLFQNCAYNFNSNFSKRYF